MSDSDQPWSNGPNAPQIPYFLYTGEKVFFAGSVIATVLYGMLSYVPTFQRRRCSPG